MQHHIYKQIVYVLICTIIIYILYQLFNYKNRDENYIIKKGDKIKTLLIILLISSFVIFYFKIGIDELQYGGEQRLHDVIQFEKSMINNINQDVEIGKVPF